MNNYLDNRNEIILADFIHDWQKNIISRHNTTRLNASFDFLRKRSKNWESNFPVWLVTFVAIC